MFSSNGRVAPSIMVEVKPAFTSWRTSSSVLPVRPMPGAAPPVRAHAWAPKSLVTRLHEGALSMRSGIYPRGWGDILAHVLEP